jgi:hypothetical protein
VAGIREAKAKMMELQFKEKEGQLNMQLNINRRHPTRRERILDTLIIAAEKTDNRRRRTVPLISNRPLIVSMSCRERSVEGTDQVQQNDHDDRDAC